MDFSSKYFWLGLMVLGLFVVMFLVLCYAFVLVNRAIKDLRGHPPSEQLYQAQEQLAERIEKLEAAQETIRRKMEEDKGTILLAGSQRGQRIYEHVKEVREGLEEKISDLSSKVEAMPERIVNLLRNIKNLGGGQ